MFISLEDTCIFLIIFSEYFHVCLQKDAQLYRSAPLGKDKAGTNKARNKVKKA